jgi:hypothetical protein
MKKYIVTMEFDQKYHGKLFEGWMSNLGEQLFHNQLDVEIENNECPKKLQTKALDFKYPKAGYIVVKSEEAE